MTYAKYSPQEVERRGEAIYSERIRPGLDAKDDGKFLVVDVESGDFEIDSDDLEATKRLLARCPGAYIYGLRIGCAFAYRLAGANAR